jgi:hypothetical protein
MVSMMAKAAGVCKGDERQGEIGLEKEKNEV